MELREKVATLVHSQWADWMKYQWATGKWSDGDLILPASSMRQWMKWATTSYLDLNEFEQNSSLQWADKYLDLMKERKEESSIECSSLWNVIDSEGRLYTVEADFYHVEEDGSLAFYKEQDGFPSSPVGVAAAYSWAFARRAR